jgi:hypothetical protein
MVSLKLQLLFVLTELSYCSNIMAKARKEGKPKRNRGNQLKRLKRIQENLRILKELSTN